MNQPITFSFSTSYITMCIVLKHQDGDMVWKLSEFQSVYNELQCYAESTSPCTNLMKFCLLIFHQYG